MMKRTQFTVYLLITTLFLSCIGEDLIDDFVEPELRLENPLETLAINDSYEFKIIYFNNIGQEEPVNINWSSDNPSIIEIESDSGIATAKQTGLATIMATTLNEQMTALSFDVIVSEQTVESDGQKSGVIESTSSYTLRGDFVLQENASQQLNLTLADNYKASSNLPGLYVYLTNNPNSINDALEVSAVTVFEGAHSYTIPEGIKLNDYEYLLYWCKPFSVKVGGGDIN